eukprot:1875292-Rhodomonas_salina.2
MEQRGRTGMPAEREQRLNDPQHHIAMQYPPVGSNIGYMQGGAAGNTVEISPVVPNMRSHDQLPFGSAVSHASQDLRISSARYQSGEQLQTTERAGGGMLEQQRTWLHSGEVHERVIFKEIPVPVRASPFC